MEYRSLHHEDLRSNHRRKLAKREQSGKWGHCVCHGITVWGRTVDLEARADDGSPKMKKVKVRLHSCFRPSGNACMRRARRRGWTAPARELFEEE